MAKLFGNRMKAKVEAREAVTIPTYSLVKKKRKIPAIIPVLVCFGLVIFLTIYLPPLLVDEPDLTTRSSVDLRASADRNAMEWAQTYMRNHPEDDFDGDGLTNEQELNAGTGVYLIDNDFDGTTDYAELYLTETNPCYADNSAINFVQQSDAKTGNVVNTPFKVHDVVMWADDYYSKARGSVIPLADGSYTFYRFQGWVQFPSEAQYAYKVVNGTQVALERNESGYFYIDSISATNVRLYTEQPESCYVVSLLGERYMLPNNIGSKILCALLPSKGFGLITVKETLVNDLDETWSEVAIINDIVTMRINEDSYDHERFGRNDLSVTDLSDIFAQIDSGNNVIISLMSHEVGEVFLEVYGYTNRNNLLVCDPLSGETFGVINIDVVGERVLDQSGSIAAYEHFEFNGCGYSSASRHRLTVVGSVNATTGATNIKTNETDAETVPDVVPEQTPEITAPEAEGSEGGKAGSAGGNAEGDAEGDETQDEQTPETTPAG